MTSITAELIELSFIVKLPTGPEKVLGHFIFILNNKVSGSLSVRIDPTAEPICFS